MQKSKYTELRLKYFIVNSIRHNLTFTMNTIFKRGCACVCVSYNVVNASRRFADVQKLLF